MKISGDFMIKKTIDALAEYESNMNKCREYRKKYLLVDNGKEIIEIYNIKLMPNFNLFKNPYVNDEIKFEKLITDLDMVNQNIIESHQIWENLKNAESNISNIIYNSYLYKRLDKLHEYIVFDLKHFIDEIIATVSIIKKYIINDKVNVSSIGDYLNKKQRDFNDFDDFLELFKNLDDLANSYKHSYANTNFTAIGDFEDCFMALYSKYNNFENQPILYSISINETVKDFNKFYKFSFKLINNLTKNAE